MFVFNFLKANAVDILVASSSCAILLFMLFAGCMNAFVTFSLSKVRRTVLGLNGWTRVGGAIYLILCLLYGYGTWMTIFSKNKTKVLFSFSLSISNGVIYVYD